VSIFFRFLTTMTPDDIYFSYPTPTPMATELSPRYPEYHRPSDGDTVTQSHESGGVILEGPPVTLGWSHLYYYVSIKKKGEKQKLRRCLLDDVTGIAPPGHLLAIMGPSGAGKTSLLNALAGRLPRSNHGELQGDITVNGRPRDKFFRHMVGYVMQDDVFFSNLTVLETLTLAARLKLPKTMTREEKDEAVQKVIFALSLSQAMNTRIGGIGKGGISGGEKKRVNVATELITRAPILFLDEPTSNLDAFQALNVMNCLRRVASGGRAVVCTIHQPRSSIYALFDQLLLLSQGKIVYYGDAKDATKYFNRQGFVCPQHFNPADYFLDVISIEQKTPDMKAEGEARVHHLAEAYVASGAAGTYLAKLSELKHSAPQEGTHQEYQVGWFEQFSLLGKRAFRQLLRDRFGFIFEISVRLFFALLFGGMFWHLGNTQQAIQGTVGLLFFVLIQMTFSQMAAVQNTFPNEKSVIMRERQAKVYHVSAYYIAKFMAELALKLWSPILFAVIIYWMARLNPNASNFFVFLFILILVAMCGTSLGLFVSALAPNATIAGSLGSLLIIVFILGGGFYENLTVMPVWMLWMQYVSFFRFAFEAVMINQFHNSVYTCLPTDTQCYTTGAQLLAYYGIPDDLGTMWMCIGILFLFIFAMHSAAFLILRFKASASFMPLNPEDHLGTKLNLTRRKDFGGKAETEKLHPGSESPTSMQKDDLPMYY